MILFAHGSRNPAWRKPFDKLVKDVAKRGQCRAVLAFGEFMTPTLAQAANALAQSGAKRAVIVPLFLGGGAHVRGDVPRLAREAAQTSGLKIKIARTVGENAAVLRAMADYSITAAVGKRARRKAARKLATSSRRKLS